MKTIEKYLSYSFLLIALLMTISCKKGSNEAWKDLFNGKDLDGWTLSGGNMNFYVENHEIVGEVRLGEPNGFLCTVDDFKDFILEYEFLPNPKLNSGVQIRSHSTADYQNFRVHGMQIEIDPSERSWTGGIYDEARRGWLYPLNGNEQARLAYKSADWNHVRVEAIRDTIKTWLNHVPAAYLVDNTDTSGFIGLQVHTVRNAPENEGLCIRFRNIRIQTENPQKYTVREDMHIAQVNLVPNTLTEWEMDQGWKLLFDGKTSGGWSGICQNQFPENNWKIENGELTSLSIPGTSGNNADILTEKKYAEFDLKFQFKLTDKASGGVKYFVNDNSQDSCSYFGLEYQIIDDKINGLQDNHKLASLYDLSAGGRKFPSPVGQWNYGRIIARDFHVEYWLNNLLVLEFDRKSDLYKEWINSSKFYKTEFKNSIPFEELKEGYILLQNENSLLSYRDIKIREIDE